LGDVNLCIFVVLLKLVDLHPHEKEWLSEHLGHSLNIHNSHYRLQDPVVEMSHLSRLLIAIESGHASQFVGKRLSDINFSGTCCFVTLSSITKDDITSIAH